MAWEMRYDESCRYLDARTARLPTPAIRRPAAPALPPQAIPRKPRVEVRADGTTATSLGSIEDLYRLFGAEI